jgi:hypothetical protein
MDINTTKLVLISKKTTSDMGFGTNSLVSGLASGLMGKNLNLYSDRTWEVQRKGKVVASGNFSAITGVKKVMDGLEVTFLEDGGKRWLRISESTTLPWMGIQSPLHALEGILEYWRSGDHTVSVPDQETVSSPIKYLGGTGTQLKSESLGTLWLTATGFALKAGDVFWSRSIGDLVGIQIGGRGIYTTGGGWVGGGFGLNGALQGAAMAGMLNALETRVHNDCLMRLSFENAELNFQILDITPRDLELKLAALRLHLEKSLGVTSSSTMGLSGTVGVSGARNDKDLKTKLQELKVAFSEGLLSESEYETRRSKLLENL